MPNQRAAFTLIELLIVVVIIGILAVMAIPKFASTKEKAYFATMKGDLRNLATAQEGYAADNNGMYASGTTTGPASLPGITYAPSTGVTMVVTASLMGWEAIASMPAPGTTKICGMFISNDDPPVPPGPPNPATNTGEPKCAP
ncbi:MAG: prepilin-type N-terminal cleavage/methylation domain-containing protein [Gemmatimonadaceae bacterium]